VNIKEKKAQSIIRRFDLCKSITKSSINSLLARYSIDPTVITDNFQSLFFNQPSQSPSIIKWHITSKCNCDCIFCYQHGLGEEDLKTSHINTITRQICDSKICFVVLTGGEVFLSKDIFNILKSLKKHRKAVIILTNGILLEEFSNEIVNLGVEQLSISIDSHIPEMHDRFRNHKGAFEKILKGIEAIKKKRNGGRPNIAIRAVILKENIQQIEEYINFFKDKVDEISFAPLQIPLSENLNCKEINLNKEDGIKLKKIIAGLEEKFSFLKLPYYKLMPQFITDPRALLNNNLFRCMGYSFILTIKNNGDVFLCPHMKKAFEDGKIHFNARLGNVKHDKLLDLWKSKRCFLIQQYLKSAKNKCICWCTTDNINTEFAGYFKN